MPRIHVGEVPICDVYAYDIGRYYVLARLQKIWRNDGIVVLRFGFALIQGVMLGVIEIVRDANVCRV